MPDNPLKWKRTDVSFSIKKEFEYLGIKRNIK